MEKTATAIGRKFSFSIVHHNDVTNRGERVDKRPKKAQERFINEDHFVFCMVDDVGDLFGKQADVQRVKHTPRTRRGEVQLKVSSGIPCKGRNATIGTNPQIIEDTTESTGAFCPLAIGLSLAASRGSGDYLLGREQFLGAIKQIREDEWTVLHKTLHTRLPFSYFPPATYN